jgi:hypothetical protein
MFGYEKDNPSYEYLKTRIFDESSDSYSAEESTIYTKNLKVAKDFFCRKSFSAKPGATGLTF